MRQFKMEGNNFLKTSQEALVNSVNQHVENLEIKLFNSEEEKTPKDEAVINELFSILEKEYKDLGLPEDYFYELNKNKIHFLSSEEFIKAVPPAKDIKIGANAYPDGSYIIRREVFSTPLQFYKANLHELIHAASFKRFSLNEKSGNLGLEKIGYKGDKFLGFNEAMTDLMTLEFMEKNKEDLRLLINFSDQEFSDLEKSLYPYYSLVEKIVDSISETKEEDRELTWERFKKGMFTGEMMHLRDIEKTYGEGALSKIASLGYKKETDQEVFDYFSVDESKGFKLSELYAA